VSLGWVLAQLHERAFGLFLLILALPCCIPFLYGVPQVVALPLMFVAVQIAAGAAGAVVARPAIWRARQITKRRAAPGSPAAFEAVAAPDRGGEPAAARVPDPRAAGPGFVGLALVVFSASILVPLCRAPTPCRASPWWWWRWASCSATASWC
jgi:hypothetical protein